MNHKTRRYTRTEHYTHACRLVNLHASAGTGFHACTCILLQHYVIAYYDLLPSFPMTWMTVTIKAVPFESVHSIRVWFISLLTLTTDKTDVKGELEFEVLEKWNIVWLMISGSGTISDEFNFVNNLNLFIPGFKFDGVDTITFHCRVMILFVRALQENISWLPGHTCTDSDLVPMFCIKIYPSNTELIYSFCTVLHSWSGWQTANIMHACMQYLLIIPCFNDAIIINNVIIHTILPNLKGVRPIIILASSQWRSLAVTELSNSSCESTLFLDPLILVLWRNRKMVV